MKLNRLVLLSLLSMFFRQAEAQDSTLVLTLKQAIEMGLDSSKSLVLSTSKMQIAQAKYNQAIDATLPSLRAAANYTRLSPINPPTFQFPGSPEPIALFPIYVNNYSAGISLSETIFSGFRLKYARESQRLLLEAARHESAHDKSEITFGIISAYFNLYKLKVSEQVIVENLAQIKQRVKETETAKRNGIATTNDVLRWQLQQSNLELTLLDIRNSIEIANYNFNLMLGFEGEKKIEPDTSRAEQVIYPGQLSDYFANALTTREDLSASDVRSQAAYNTLRVAQNSYLPRISVGADFLDARPNPRYIPPIDEFRTTWSVGLSLNWDLVSLYSNRHNVDEYRAVYRQAMEAHDILSDEIKSEINKSYLLLTEAIVREKVMRKSVEQANENYRLLDARFKNSLVILSDLLEGNNLLISSQINLAIAKADIEIAYYRLLKSTGTINN